MISFESTDYKVRSGRPLRRIHKRGGHPCEIIHRPDCEFHWLSYSCFPNVMSEGRHDELDIDDLMRLLHVQVLHYEREKLACRLRVCFAVQLVRSHRIIGGDLTGLTVLLSRARGTGCQWLVSSRCSAPNSGELWRFVRRHRSHWLLRGEVSPRMGIPSAGMQQREAACILSEPRSTDTVPYSERRSNPR